MFYFKIFLFLFLTSFCVSSEEFKFKKISFYGLTYFSENFVFDEVLCNKEYVSEVDLLKALNSLNIFNKIDIYWNNDELKVFLTEKSLINKVVIHVDNDKDYILSILSKLNIVRGAFYDFNKLSVFRKNIEDFYKFGGFDDPVIELDIDANCNTNLVNVSIKISKKINRYINDIDIIGVNAFNKGKLLALLSYSKRSWMSLFLKDNIFFSDLVENDLDLIRAYYFDKGYSDFQIDFIRVFLLNNESTVNILVSIFEGDRYHIYSVNFNFDKFTLKNEKLITELNDLVFSNLKSGDFFSRQVLFEVKNKIKELLIFNNIFDFDINFMVFYFGESRLKIEFTLNKSIRPKIRYINFIGNFLTCDSTLRSMIPAFEGSNLFNDDVELGRDEIIKHGISNFVSVEYIRNPENNRELDIIYFINEQKFGKISAGLSYGSDDGFSINFSSELSNFLGIGNDISLDINNNGIESDFAFTYYIPYFFRDNYGVGYNVYYKSDIFDQDMDDFDIFSETFGAYLYYSFDFTKFLKINVGIGCDMTFLGMCDEYFSNEIKSFIEKMGFDFKEYFFNFILIYNSLSPMSGFNQNLNFRINIPGSKSKYFTVNYDINYYNNFYDDYVFSLYSGIYYGNVYDECEIFPFFKNFHIKGVNNIRGFKERSLGPQDSNEDVIGGNFLTCAKFSLFVPTPFPDDIKDVKTSIFFDIGNVYNTNSFIDENFRSKLYYYISSLKFSLGFSFLWSTPFGLPLEVSIAYPFNVEDEDSKSIISISFG